MRKRVIIATFIVGFALFVNLAVVNPNIGDQEDSYTKANSEDNSLIRYLEEDYKLVKGEDGTIFLVKEDILEDQTIESFEVEETKSDDEPFVEEEASETIKLFADFEDLKNYLSNNSGTYYPYRGGFNDGLFLAVNKDIDDSDSDGLYDESGDFSTTNNQELGVDEGDVLKNDGDYAYIVSKDKSSVFIVDVNPPGDTEIVSTIDTSGTIQEIYINEDTLVVLGRRTVFRIDPFPMNETSDSVLLENGEFYYFNYISYSATFMDIYDVSDRGSPELQKTHVWRGGFVQSRMIGDYVYLIMTQRLYNNMKIWDLPVPAEEIYYFDGSNDTERPSGNHQLLCVRSVNIVDLDEEPISRFIMMRSSNHIYVSENNIYVTDRYYYYNSDKTTIHRIGIEDGGIRYEAKGDVPGWVMGRFSMGEQGDYFRIASSKGRTTSHGVYVMNMDMEIVGSVEGIAPGENMHSARFMGNRAYLVTFKKVDPFFVINLTDPENPHVLGELKIPGYSDYLHPYDENHVIGLGKDTYDMGNFAWYQGVKLSLFDVTDVHNPIEKSQYIIGDRGTYSPALNDPHSFLFSKSKNLLVIPIVLYEINETRYPNPSPSTHGEFTWQGVYVFDLTTENGFQLSGKIDHPEDPDDGGYYRWYYGSDSAIYRSFYIGNTLHTVSYNYLKANDLGDLHEIDLLELPNDDEDRLSPPIMCIEVGYIPR
jgi:uncharacterized secreted protein with C-terminal beta-propeller domain